MTEAMAQRLKWLDDHFYIEAKDNRTSEPDKIVVRRRSYYGVDVVTDGTRKELLPTIFDRIDFITPFIVEAEIAGAIGYYSMDAREWVVEPVCDSVTFYDFYHTVELVSDGKHGLLDLGTQRVVIPMSYEDVAINADNDYLWVKYNSTYHFVERVSGKRISVPDAIMAYDMPHSMFVKNVDGIVRCVNENGVRDDILMRQEVARQNGRVRLMNNKLHILEIIDLYGYILN